MLIADVSEPPISSIFIGRWMKYKKGWDVILHPPAYEDGTDRGFRNVGY